MMRNIIHRLSFAALGIISVTANAQVGTRGGNATTDTTGRVLTQKKDTATHRMMLIPFLPKMCMSEIGKDVNAHTHQSFDEITLEFRNQLDLAMYAALRKSYVTVSLLQSKRKSDTTLDYVYASTGYQYDVVPGTTADANGQAEYDTKNQKTHFINNGQLQVPVDYSNRFMNVHIDNSHLLADLGNTFHTDTYIFINELDIKNVPNTTTNSLTEDEYRREVTVHYSIIDKDGKYVSKGIATTYFPYRENDPKEIGEKYFSVIAHEILKNYIQAITQAQMAQQQKNKTSKK